jgi:hypothetical protein
LGWAASEEKEREKEKRSGPGPTRKLERKRNVFKCI